MCNIAYSNKSYRTLKCHEVDSFSAVVLLLVVNMVIIDITTRFMDITLRLRSRLNLFILTKKVDDI